MARKSLRPHFNQIRLWANQGRTDAWIAHQLEVTVQQIEVFRRENDLAADAEAVESNSPPADFAFDDEVDLRAEDDALIAAELEAEERERAEQEARRAAKEAERKAAQEARQAAKEAEDSEGDGGAEEDRPRRRRNRRGGRGRRKAQGPYEATFDHGEEGYGLWLDPAVADDPVYAEHWAGHRAIEVTVQTDRIIISRAGENEAANSGSDPEQ
jgi:hypothetical protein